MLDLGKFTCRFCKNLFCCENCKLKHLVNKHQLNTKCEFCVFGEGVIDKTIPADLLVHIESFHCPIFCKTCQKTHNSAAEIMEHISQPVKNTDTPSERNAKLTPATPYPAAGKYLHDTIDLATSTPLPNYQDARGNNVFQTLTPVEYPEVESLNKGSAVEKIKQEHKHVTFCETPNSDTQRVLKEAFYAKKPKMLDKIELEQEIPQETDEDNGNFDGDDKKQNEDGSPKVIVVISDNVESGDEEVKQDPTLWASAISFPEEETQYENVNSHFSETSSIWKSVTGVVNSLMNFSRQTYKCKRSREEEEEKSEEPIAKRFKRIKCRPPIRNLDTVIYLKRNRPIMVDKWTQTD